MSKVIVRFDYQRQVFSISAFSMVHEMGEPYQLTLYTC